MDGYDKARDEAKFEQVRGSVANRINQVGCGLVLFFCHDFIIFQLQVKSTESYGKIQREQRLRSKAAVLQTGLANANWGEKKERVDTMK